MGIIDRSATPSEGRRIPLSVPNLAGNEARYLKECVDTNWVSSAGPFVDRLEAMVAQAAGAPHGVAMVNGTAALHLALVVAGVGPKDAVPVSSMTFIAPANTVRYVGAEPVFIDAEPAHAQMDPDALAGYLRSCKKGHDGLIDPRSGRRVRAVLPVHILGHPCDMEPIMELAEEHGLVVIEDATESLGATVGGRATGGIGDIGCFSFNGNKIVTAGGGGLLVSRRKEWADRARYLSTQAKDDPVEYVHGAVGYNYRLTNLQAAVAVAQMEQLERFVARKREIAAVYSEAFADVAGIDPIGSPPWGEGTYWLYTVRVDKARFGRDRRGLMEALAKAGIESRPLWQPMHRSPAHPGAHRDCPVADALRAACLSLPCSTNLTPADQDQVVRAVRAAAKRA